MEQQIFDKKNLVVVLDFVVVANLKLPNIGAEAAVNIFKELNLEPGEYFLQGVGKINKERIAKAEFKGKEENKKQRKVLRGLKKKKNDKQKQKEGTLNKEGGF